MERWRETYDNWKTTDPRDYIPRCPDCGSELIEDGYGGFDCIECDWSISGPDPDAARDRLRDQEWLDREEEYQ